MFFKDIGGVKVTLPSKDDVTIIDLPTGNDDSNLIQDALERGRGGKVILPANTYKVSKTIYVPENTTFVGYGLSSRIEPISYENLDEIPLRTEGITSTIKPLITNERPKGVMKTKGVLVSNIHIVGEGVVESIDTRIGGIIFADAENCHTDMVFINYINWSTNDNVNKRGFNLLCVRSTNCTFNRGMLDHAGYECFGVYDDSSNIVATNMLIKNGMRCSAQIHQNTSDVIFSHNILMMDKAGGYSNGSLLLHGRDGLTVSDVIISDNIMYCDSGVAVLSVVETSENISIHDNIIKGGDIRGIRLGDLDGVNQRYSIKNNRIEVDGTGIFCVEIGDMSAIVYNSIISRTGSGIRVDSCDALDLSHNNIKSQTYGMRVDNIEHGVFIDKNIIDAANAFYGDYENKAKVLMGQNMVIE